MIKWKDEFKIGVSTIDQQHKQLFKIAEDVYNLLKDEFCTDKYDKIIVLLNELKDYTILHFNSEQEYMLSIGYKRYFSHKVEHDDFISKINSINLSTLDQNQDSYILELLDMVTNWIEKHILEKDKSIKAD